MRDRICPLTPILTVLALGLAGCGGGGGGGGDMPDDCYKSSSQCRCGGDPIGPSTPGGTVSPVTECSQQSFLSSEPAIRCCEGRGGDSTGYQYCECNTYSCGGNGFTDAADCFCSFGAIVYSSYNECWALGTGPMGPDVEGIIYAGSTCCRDLNEFGGCTCSDLPCDSDQEQVDHCAADNAFRACPSWSSLASECSP